MEDVTLWRLKRNSTYPYFLGAGGDKPKEKELDATLSSGGYPSEMRGGMGIDPPFLVIGIWGFGDWWLFGAWETLTWR